MFHSSRRGTVFKKTAEVIDEAQFRNVIWTAECRSGTNFTFRLNTTRRKAL